MINNKREKINKAIISITIISILAGCGTDNSLSKFLYRSLLLENFDKNSSIEYLSKNVIVPDYQRFVLANKNLKDKINKLSMEINLVNLQETQEAWKDSMKIWQHTEVFQIGPVKNLRLKNSIEFWPARPVSIQEVLDDTKTLNDEYLKTLGAAKKGLPVIEYLIFNQEENNSDLIEKLKNESRRIQYLKLLSQDLLDNSTLLVNSWLETNGNYITMFTNDDQNYSMLVNQMISFIEIVKDTKVGKPLGKSSGGDKRPEEVESLFSKNSLENLVNNLEGFKQFFNGIDFNGNNGKGMDDYLLFVDQESLKDKINKQIDITISSIKDISLPLQESVEKNQEGVENVYQQLKELLRLVKVDMANSVNAAVHFNDSDGD